jgi:long-chain acyl-CoA synthetase
METEIPNKLEDTEFFKEHANLVDFFNNSCNKHSEKIAFESYGVEMSFDELSLQVNSFASWLSQNFKPGDRIALMMPNMLASLSLNTCSNSLGVYRGFIFMTITPAINAP